MCVALDKKLVSQRKTKKGPKQTAHCFKQKCALNKQEHNNIDLRKPRSKVYTWVKGENVEQSMMSACKNNAGGQVCSFLETALITDNDRHHREPINSTLRKNTKRKHGFDENVEKLKVETKQKHKTHTTTTRSYPTEQHLM